MSSDPTTNNLDGPITIEADGAWTYQLSRQDSVTEVVVTIVATATNTSPTDLPPLWDAIEPDALDRLVNHQTGSDLQVRFRYAGHSITIEGQTVRVTALK